MTKPSVLIAGAGIAGPTLAFWLSRHGMNPVIVERAPGLRTAGQTIDIRGAGREVIRRMGIEQLVRSRTTQEEGLAFVDSANRIQAAFAADTFGGEGLVSEIEIVRSELAALLYEQSRNDAEYIFDDRIAALTPSGNRLDVRFLKGGERTFDLVIAADGMRSKTRAMVFEGPSPIHRLGQCTAYFTIPHHASDAMWARWYNAPGGRCMMLRPDNLGTTRAFLGFITPPRGYDELDAVAQRELMGRVFADAGWEAPRILAALADADDFYLEEIGQVKMPHWSKGRVALLGDAGYCPSPISGKGTTLALVGAYILAGELARHSNHEHAFAAYEARMRPHVTKAQKLTPGAPRLACPQTRLGITALNTALRVAAQPRAQRFFSRFAQSSPSVALPGYDA